MKETASDENTLHTISSKYCVAGRPKVQGSSDVKHMTDEHFCFFLEFMNDVGPA